jgi:pimeloyl-ACP methyl ester carboxylesterase
VECNSERDGATEISQPTRNTLRTLLALAFLFIAGLTSVCLAATSKQVSYNRGDGAVHAIIYTPQGKGPLPGVLVIHEWWGLNDWVKQQASNLADQGYVTVAIDLYRGKVATTPELAHEITRLVPEDRAKRDLHAADVFLRWQPEVRKDRTAAVGWCMGGGYALDVALQEPSLTAVVINYGHLATDPESLRKSMPRFSETSALKTRELRQTISGNSGKRSSRTENLWTSKSTPMPDTRLKTPTITWDTGLRCDRRLEPQR